LVFTKRGSGGKEVNIKHRPELNVFHMFLILKKKGKRKEKKKKSGEALPILENRVTFKTNHRGHQLGATRQGGGGKKKLPLNVKFCYRQRNLKLKGVGKKG